MLVVKFPRRKNVKTDVSSDDPVSDEERALAHALFPVRRIWPRLVENRRPSGYMFPPLTSSKFNKTFERVMVGSLSPNGSR